MWSPIAYWCSTAELDGTTLISQKVTFNKNVVLRAYQSWFVLYNDPAFTNIRFRIYSNNNGSPGVLLHTSENVITKAELLTGINTSAIRGMFFEFDYPSFNDNDVYHFVPIVTGYTGTTSSHLAWVKGWPDPEYRTNVTTTYTSAGRNPYRNAFVGAEL